MRVQDLEITYGDLKARPELWPIIEAEIERLQRERRAVCQRLRGSDDCVDLPGVVAEVLTERIEAQRRVIT